MYCIRCGKEIPADASFCPYCREDMRPVTRPTSAEPTYTPSEESMPTLLPARPKKERRPLSPFSLAGLCLAVAGLLVTFSFIADVYISGLFFSILPIPAVALVFSIIGFKESSRKNLFGKPIATPGIGISAFSLAIISIVFMVLLQKM